MQKQDLALYGKPVTDHYHCVNSQSARNRLHESPFELTGMHGLVTSQVGCASTSVVLVRACNFSFSFSFSNLAQ